MAIQITVYDNHVCFSVPYWYQGQKAEQLFDQLRAYIKIIWETAGYFVSDPQTGEVFDPAEKEFDGLEKYLSVSDHLDELVNSKGFDRFMRTSCVIFYINTYIKM